MKKIAIASIIAMTATAASAWELGVTATRDNAGADRNFGGVTLSQPYGKLNATAGVERTSVSNSDQTRWSLVGGVDLAKFGPVTVAPKVGVAYLDNQFGHDGYAMTVGVGASVPVTKKVTFVTDVVHQYGQDRVQQFDGNRVTVGLRYKF